MIALGEDVAQILVRNLDDPLKARLQRRAKRNGRSMEAEAREILREALRKEEAVKGGLGSEIVAMFSGQGIGLEEGEEIQEIRGMRMQIPTFDE
jgi:antitoxin FitA